MNIEKRIRIIEKMSKRMIPAYVIGLFELNLGHEMTPVEESQIQEAVKIISNYVSRGLTEALVIFKTKAPIISVEIKNIEQVMQDAETRIKTLEKIEKS